MPYETLRAEELRNLGPLPFETALPLARRIYEEQANDRRPYKFARTTLGCLGGLESVGKTTLAEKLKNHVSFVHLNKDRINDLFSPRRDDDVYKATRKTAHKLMYALAREYLASGISVILDAPFKKKDYLDDQEWVADMHALAEETGADIKFAWLTVPDEIWKERLLGRDAERDQGRFERLLTQPNEVPPIPFSSHIVFDTHFDDPARLIDFLGIVPLDENRGEEVVYAKPLFD